MEINNETHVHMNNEERGSVLPEYDDPNFHTKIIKFMNAHPNIDPGFILSMYHFETITSENDPREDNHE